MKNAIFITGTDTGVGKTIVTGLLGRLFTERGIKTITQKWVQTGCAGVSEDIAVHMGFIRNGERYIEKYHSDMAPYVLEFPSSPHLAALLEKKHIDAAIIERSFRRLEKDFDLVLVEGSGGLMVPINDEKMIVDIVERLRLSVLVVAQNRLGAINQTLLTVEALRQRGLEILGIVFNRVSQEGDELILKDNKRIIGELTGEDVLGELTYSKDMEKLYETFLPVGERILQKI
ncbi:MAG: dethiobiotin synthase [Candidatus Omnitrophota bacterium]